MFNKIKIAFAIIVFTISACSNPQLSSESNKVENILKNDSVQQSKDTLKNTVVNAEINTPKEVSGNVTFKNQYCGGAWPSDEILESYETQYPLTSSTILLKNNKQKDKVIEINTDKEGHFNSPLEPGTYDYYMTKSYNKDMNCAFKADCKKWLNKCFGQITIKEGKYDGYKIVFAFECNPCEPNNRP